MRKINVALFLLICSSTLLAKVARAQLGPLPAAEAVRRGEEIFNATCTGMCHGAGGSPGNGAPQLAERGLNGSYIESTITYGKPGTAMPAWGQKLPVADLAAVITYVKNLNGIRAVVQKSKLSLSPREENGRKLFYDETGQAKRCSICHRINGQGVEIAPLANVPSNVHDLHAVATPNVSAVTVGSETFPALVEMRTTKETKVYDLSTMPPPLRTFQAPDVKLSKDSSWKHEGVLAGYTDDDLEAILAFLRVENYRQK